MDTSVSYEELICLDSWLPLDRRKQISEYLVSIIPDFLEYREEYVKRLQKQTRPVQLTDISIPAWQSISRTDSETGWRLILGLRDQKCSYRKLDTLGSGCFNCGFYADTETGKKATALSALGQLNTALEFGKKSNKNFDVIEFLSDGSFLSDLSLKVKETLVSEVSKLSYIKRLLIESRPDGIYKNHSTIKKIISMLGKDRTLEIATGLESADEFVRAACIHKGFSKQEFEKGLETIARLKKDTGTNISYLSYMIIKPAFLTTEESIIDSIKTLEYLNVLMKESKVNIIPKLEPATVPEGTLFTILFSIKPSNPFHYKILNYWAVLEILVRASNLESCKDVLKIIRIGERNDMGENIYLPGIYNRDEELEPLPEDEILYHSIQEFNYHHDLSKIMNSLKAIDASESLKAFVDIELKGHTEIKL